MSTTACDHIRQYFEAGRPMPCANPYCRDGIGGAVMCVPVWRWARERQVLEYLRIRHDADHWSWEAVPL